jgi:hypothetical protein
VRLTLALLLVAGAASAQEPQDWACTAEDGAELRVSLWQPSDLGASLHCVEAGLPQGELCAPDGGWGLGGPDGLALTQGLGRPTTTGFGSSPCRAFAVRGLGVAGHAPAPGAGGRRETFWRMRLDLATGSATTYARDGSQSYDCAEAG